MNAFLYLILTTASLFFSHLPLVAQSDTAYKPFPTKDAMWVYTYDDTKGTVATYHSKSIQHYCIAGDTVIDSKTYQSVASSVFQIRIYGALPNDSSYRFSDRPSYFFREENKKIYKYDTLRKKEYLLYNFNVIQGDTLTVDIPNWDQPLKYVIDTIYKDKVGSKIYEWRPVRLGPFFPIRVVEGIGASDIDFMTNYNFQEGEWYYYHSFFSSLIFGDKFKPSLCRTFTKREDQFNFKKLLVDFVLRNDKLYMMNTDSKDFPLQLTLLNPLGVSVLESTIDSENAVISLPFLPEGIYLVEVYSMANQKSCTRKMLFTFN